MAKKKEPLESPDVVRDIGTIKRLSSATVIILAVIVLMVVITTFFQMRTSSNPEKIQDYIGKHREVVGKVFEKEEGLEFADLALSAHQEQTEKTSDVRLWLDVIVRVDKTTPVSAYDDKRVQGLKAKVAAILVDPPLGAKVRLILRSETVID